MALACTTRQAQPGLTSPQNAASPEETRAKQNQQHQQKQSHKRKKTKTKLYELLMSIYFYRNNQKGTQIYGSHAKKPSGQKAQR